jgi:hypothetical protein
MKRDPDFTRDLLLRIEGGQSVFETADRDEAAILHRQSELSREEAERLRGHLDSLEQDRLIEIEFKSLAHAYSVRGLTSKGRALLDTMRSP